MSEQQRELSQQETVNSTTALSMTSGEGEVVGQSPLNSVVQDVNSTPSISKGEVVVERSPTNPSPELAEILKNPTPNPTTWVEPTFNRNRIRPQRISS